MRVLIVHHGRLPAPGLPATGGAIRAWLLGQGLREAGHEVQHLAREADQPGGFASPADLVRKARHLRPEALVCVQLEDAPALRALDLPLVVDLYAPRLLEAPFEGTMARVGPAVLDALGAGDVFLVSSPRQAWSWLGVLALAGIDVTRDPCLQVPIASRPVPRKRAGRAPLFVAGGSAWPWADPGPSLQRVLVILDGQDLGRVRWFGPAQGLPVHPRLETPGWRPWDELLAEYSGATAALDWMEPNPERCLALGFRHADYLSAGLPVLCSPGGAVAEVLGEAGWAGPIEEVLPQVLADHRQGAPRLRAASRAAQALARARSPGASVTPLLGWLSAPRSSRAPAGPLLDLAALARRAATAEAGAEALAQAMARAEAEVAHKRQENAGLTAQVQTLLGTVDRQARALDEVAGFKREAIAVLGGRGDQAVADLDAARARIASLQADLEKKNAELRGADEVRARLEDDLARARAEIERLHQKGWLRR